MKSCVIVHLKYHVCLAFFFEAHIQNEAVIYV